MVGESCDVFAIRVLIVQTFAVSCVNIQALTHLFVKIPQPGDSKGTFLASILSYHVLTSDPKRISLEEIPLPTSDQRNNKQTC